MSSSKVDICNSALAKIGVERISSLSGSSKAAVLCNQQYDKIRKKVLRSHLWDFATKRVELAKISSNPLFEYSAQFQLPSDCLRVVDTHLGTQMDFVIEGKYLLMNNDTCKIVYIADIEDVSYFDSYFEEALAYYLASDLAYPLKQDMGLKQMMKENALLEIADARSFDAQQGRLQKMLQEDVWLDSRVSGTEAP